MVRDTSIATYNQIKAEGLLSKRRLQVYEVLYAHGPLIGEDVSKIVKSKHGDWSQSETIRNRLTELRDMGVVSEVKIVENGRGRQVILWDVTSKLPVKLEKPETKTEKIKRLEKRIEVLERDNRMLRYGNRALGRSNKKLIEQQEQMSLL